ncbi:hypothetical protein VII00023_15533 [Vibrio ichthyoenteri ATCC 700023]|uniref:HTH cro/C1-type domain-containing protein n=1 Tax=Vibrio ichthyoenteri ATCC 700023 TaxID=870968 RepID=F9RZ03_9VIBR|nr:helix-turn-helix transcriptional regulator [Vibrio ichthyoenteri]EGU46161.1 hypothetical protein VII00023_15533 [Vibrio ichthyoenteri ATCC 700023]
MDKENSALAANLVLHLKNKGLSKSELAREMSVTRQTVQVWLKKGTVSRDNLMKLSSFFNTSVSSLVGEKNAVSEMEVTDANVIKQELKLLIDSVPSSHIILLQYLKKMLSK